VARLFGRIEDAMVEKAREAEKRAATNARRQVNILLNGFHPRGELAGDCTDFPGAPVASGWMQLVSGSPWWRQASSDTCEVS